MNDPRQQDREKRRSHAPFPSHTNFHNNDVFASPLSLTDQHMQNPNYFYINYHQHSAPPPQGNQYPSQFNSKQMDTGLHHHHQSIYSNLLHNSLVKSESLNGPSSLVSTPQSTPSISSLSMSSNSSSSLSVNSESNKVGQGNAPKMYDASGHLGYKASYVKTVRPRLNGPLPDDDDECDEGVDPHTVSNSSLDSAGSLKRSSESGYTSLPKYVKPKICKSSLMVQSVSSKRVAKPQPQLATFPTSQGKANCCLLVCREHVILTISNSIN